jgi:hypothetical protein
MPEQEQSPAQDQPPAQEQPPVENEKQRTALLVQQLEQQHLSGANWFFWIAALSIINSIVALSGSQWGFIVGLGITRVIDAIAFAAAAESGSEGTIKLIAFGINLVIAGFVAVWGYLARKRHRWAYVTGMVLYGLDGAIFVFAQDYLSVGFHAFVLFQLFRGYQACGQVNEMAARAMRRAQAA